MTKSEILMLSDQEIAEEIAKKVREKRIELNITQKAFAKQVKMSYISYMKFERTGETSAIKLIRVIRRLSMLGDMLMAMANHDSIESVGAEEYFRKSALKKRQRAR